MEENELSPYLRVIQKRLWLILLIFIATMAVVVVAGVSSSPVYRSSLRLQTLAVEPEEVTLFSPQRTVATAEQLVITQNEFIAVLEDGEVAWRTINNLGLTINAMTLLDRLTIQREAEFIAVIAEGESPQQAESIVTTHVDNALREYRQRRTRGANVTGQFIENQLVEAQSRLTAAENDLLRFQLRHNVGNLDQEINSVQNQVRSLRQERDRALLDAERAAALVEPNRQQAEAARESADEALQQRNALADIPQNEDLIARLTNDFNYYRNLARNYEEAANQQAINESGHREVAGNYDRLAVEADTRLSELIGLRADYNVLADRVDALRRSRDFLQNKADEARLKEAQGLSVGYLQVVSPPRTPDQPVAARTLQISLVAGLVSLLAGVVLAFVLEFLESLSRSPQRRPGTA